MIDDIINLESGDLDEIEAAEAMQRTINEGSAWRMQGSWGRSMMAAIESGRNMLGNTPSRDYWGNHIPSREQVKDGTKGSYGFVAEAMGAEYADRLAAL